MNQDNELVTMYLSIGDDGGFTQAISDVYKSKFKGIYLHDNADVDVKSFFKDEYLTTFNEE